MLRKPQLYHSLSVQFCNFKLFFCTIFKLTSFESYRELLGDLESFSGTQKRTNFAVWWFLFLAGHLFLISFLSSSQCSKAAVMQAFVLQDILCINKQWKVVVVEFVANVFSFHIFVPNHFYVKIMELMLFKPYCIHDLIKYRLNLVRFDGLNKTLYF